MSYKYLLSDLSDDSLQATYRTTGTTGQFIQLIQIIQFHSQVFNYTAVCTEKCNTHTQ